MFAKPTTDIAFKKLFSNKDHTEIVIDFLNAILKRTGDKTIVSVEINDPYNIPENFDDKLSIVDVRCTDQQGNNYIVEMQAIKQPAFAKRSQYYTALALSRQVRQGEHFDKLTPVIFLGVLNFTLFHNERYVSHHLILDSHTHEHVLDHMEFHFIELPKFKKNLDEVNNDSDKWIYFLKNAGTLYTIPSKLEHPTALYDAFQVLKQRNWTVPELEIYDKAVDTVRREEERLASVLKEGEAKGFAVGREEGRLEGKLEEKRNMARNLLGILDVEKIAETTGLTIEEINSLR